MKRLLTFLTLLTLFFTTGWAQSTVLFHETFGNNTGSARNWSDSYSEKSGIASVYNGITSYTVSNLKQGKNTTGYILSGINQSTSGTDAYIIIGPLNVSNYNNLGVTYQWKAGSIKGTYYTSLYYATSANGTYTEVSGTGAGATTFVERSYSLPATAQVSTLYLKIVFNTSNTQAIIDEVELTGETGSSTPTTYSLTLPTGLAGGSVSATGYSDLTAIPSGTNMTVTALPNTGYTLEYMKANGVNVENPFTFSISEDTEITASFAALPIYGITVTNGTANPTSAYEGQTVTLTPTIPDGKVIDWDNTTVTPSTLEINHSDYTFIMPAQAVTVAFAFKNAPTYTNIFERITSTSDLEVGKRYLIVCEDKNQALCDQPTGTAKGATSVTISNHQINLSNVSNVGIFNLLSGYKLQYYSNNNYYLYNTNTNDGLKAGTTSQDWTITFDTNGNAIISGTDDRYIFNYDGQDFRTYHSKSQDYQYYVQLYKEVEETPQSSDVYIVGQINGHDSDPWVSTEGVQLTYNSSTDTYGADIYCTGMKNGNDDGYSYFLFAKSLPFDWNNTGNLYGSGADGSYWPISGLPNESAFDEEIPLYEGSKNVYRLPAGLYTVTVDLDYTGHQYTTKSVKVTKRDVTLNITNGGTFTDTKNVTMTSNLTELGGKIYYTTNGNDPRDQYSGRQEYTEQLTLDATTTIKAVAVLGCIYSDVVEKTYTKKPAAPVITPASCTFNEPLTVTITAESGATIYYTTDGSDPSDQSTQYTGPFTVSTTTIVKAIAYVGEAYSNIATATYTYSNVQPSTGDFVLVTSADQLVAGNEYIIVTTYGGSDYAMGALTTGNNPKGSRTTDFTITGTVGTSGSRITAGSEVNVLTLGSTGGAWTLKQSDESYITLGTNTNISSSSSTCALTINISNNVATIQGPNSGPSASTPRQILHQAGTSNCFGNYASSNVGGNNYSDIYLYTRATNSVQPPVFSPIAGIYNVDIDVTISCATDGATIYYTTDGTEPSATNGTEYTGEIVVSESTTFKAIAVKGDNSSSVVTAAYTIQKSTNIETVTLDYREPFTAGIGKFFVTNNTGFSPVWTLDGNFGVKGTSYEPATGTNHAATSRLVSPIIDMTDAVQPEMTFSHQINSFFNDVTTQATLWIRETTNGTNGTWVQLPITFSDPAAAGGWTNDVVDIDLTDVNGVSYAGKKVQISFLYTNPTEGSGAGTWEIQNFVVADNSEYRMVNNIAEFLALENGTKAKFKNPVTVLYDYAQRGDQEYIWVKDESGYMQFFLQPTLNSSTESTLDPKAAYYENGDIIPAGFVVVKNYYENGKYVQAYSTEALDAGFELATQKGLADPDHYEFSTLNALTLSDADIAANCNRYITVEKVMIASKSGKNFTFADENGTVNACVGYNKYNGDGSLLKDGTTSADVTVPAVSNTYYNVKGIIQIWQGGWEIMPIEFTEWKVDEVTLRKLCADGVVNNEYKISNNLLGVYASEDGTKLWVKDDTGQSISPDAPDATYKDNFPINAEGNTRLDQALYDQSNWCEIQLTSENAGDFVGKIIKGGSIDGTFTNKTNPTMTGVTLTNDNIYSDGSYEPNYYIPCNFYGNQSCQTSQHGQPGHGDYFFMTPKPQEYAMVVWAIWDSENEQFVVNENPQYNSHGFQGSFKVDLSLNQNPNIALHDGMDDNFAYNFSAIIRVNSSKAGNDFMVYPLDLSAATDPATAIESVVSGNGEVKSVKFYNVAGIESATPFQGVNIVVTEYTDGSRTTTKMLRK